MPKRFFSVVLSVTLSMILGLSLAGCGLIGGLTGGVTGGRDDQPPWPDLPLSFEYNYGSFNGGEWNYQITRETAQDSGSGGLAYRFIARGYNGVDMDIDEIVDEADMEFIAAIVWNQDLASWDGFDERDSDILDGYSFNLAIEYEDHSIVASGYERFPRDYDVSHAALSTALGNMVRKIEAAA